MSIGTAARYLIIAGLVVSVAAAIAAFYAAGWQHSLPDLPLQLRNKDFANYWMAGKLTLESNASVLFGPPDAYFAAMKAVFGADYPWHNWSYPPHAVLWLVPLGLLPFVPAMILFLGVTLALYLVALSTLEARWSPMPALLLLPFVAANLASTQNGFLTTALMIAGLALRARNPILAGILLGILTFKPQLGFLLPILLLVERRWRVILSAAATAFLLFVLSVVAFGLGSWVDYVAFVAPYQTEVMNKLGGDFPFMMGSAFGAVRGYGLDANAALLIHIPFAAIGIVLFVIGLWKITDFHARAFVTLLASLVISPYSVSYDFGAVATFAALWPLVARDDVSRPHLRIPMLLVAMLPIIMLPLGKIGLPLTPVVLVAALCAVLASQQAFTRPSRPSPATR
jgi:arabinofuranan 3-O-arabinosyltransferase